MAIKTILMGVLGCIAAGITLALPASAQTPSAYDFMKPATNKDLIMSPSGRYIAYSNVETSVRCVGAGRRVVEKTKCSERQHVYSNKYKVNIFDLETLAHVRAFEVPDNIAVQWLQFANDDRLLISMQGTRAAGRQKKRLQSTGKERIFSIPVKVEDGDKYATLFENRQRVEKSRFNRKSVVNLLRDDKDHVIMSASNHGELDLWKVNVNTGKVKAIAFGSYSTVYWYTNKAGEPSLRYDCSGECRVVHVFAPNDKGVWRAIKKYSVNPDEEIQDAAFYPAAFSENKNQVLVLSEEDADARRMVKTYDFSTGEFLNTVYEHPEYDVSGVVTDTKTGDYLGVTYYDDRIKYDFVDDKIQRHFDGLNAYFGDQANVSLIGQNESGERAVIFVSQHNMPGRYYLYDFKTRKPQKLISTEPELERGINSDGKVLKVPMRDGSAITAYHYYPKGQETGAPLLVMPHGGPHLRDHFSFDYWAQYFVSNGYQVVSMNFRGSTGYGRAFKEAGYGEWGGLMQDDITDTVKYFHERKIASPDATCIVGYSYGGYAALYGGATTPELYKCIVSGGGVSDLVLSMSDDQKTLSKESYVLMKKSMGDPKADKDKLRAKSPLFFAAQFDDPVLLLHGEYDPRVMYHHSSKIHKALKKANQDVTMIEMPNVGHNGWDLRTDIKYLEDVRAFLDEHIGQ